MTIFDKDGFLRNNLSDTASEGTPIIGTNLFYAAVVAYEDLRYDDHSGTKRRLRVFIHSSVAADVSKVVIEIAALTSTDPTIDTTAAGKADANKSKAVHHVITVSKGADTADVPKVVSIQRLRPSSQSVVSAFQEERIAPEPFDVRIVLTDAPHGLTLLQRMHMSFWLRLRTGRSATWL